MQPNNSQLNCFYKMEIKLSLRYLCFALLCTSLYPEVVGGLTATGAPQHPVHNQDGQEDDVVDVTDNDESVASQLNQITNRLQYDLRQIIMYLQTKQLESSLPAHHVTDEVTTSNIMESIVKLNQRLAGIEYIQDTIIDKFDIFENNINRNDKDSTDKIQSNDSCSIPAPSSVRVDTECLAWMSNHTPAEDELDRFVVYKTGCSYMGLKFDSVFTTAMNYNGSWGEWRGAVRATHGAVLRVLWTPAPPAALTRGFTIYIGEDDDDTTNMYEWKPWSLLARQSTPRILSAARYVPFYVRIQAGVLTFGRECDVKPMFTREVSVPPGQVELQLHPFSSYGGKFLYCLENTPALLGVY